MDLDLAINNRLPAASSQSIANYAGNRLSELT